MRSNEVVQDETPMTDWEMEMGTDTSRPDGGRRSDTDRLIEHGQDIDGPHRRRASWSLLIGLVTAMLIAVGTGVASAGATSSSSSFSIEQVWSFGGGQIAIEPEGNGKLEGVVLQPTQFATCTHPVEEKIWKEMTLQPDGSYWGYHQWFNTTAANSTDCTYDPTPGKTAWRLLSGANGSYTLRVCLSRPSKNSQPTIAADGAPFGESEYAAYGVTYGCFTSELIGPLPASGAAGSGIAGSGVAGSKETLIVRPSTKRCVSGRRFKIHVQDPTYDPLAAVSVTLRRHKTVMKRSGKYFVATINLKGLPKNAFTINLSATTVLGHHLTGRRTYHTCIPKIKPKKQHEASHKMGLP
jgi:hypothetical protein